MSKDEAENTRCYTVAELARRWRCRPEAVRGMIQKGTLAAIKISGTIRITPEAVAEAERGPLAVKPVRRVRREKLDPEIVKLLES